MVDVAIEEMVGSDRVPTGRLQASLGGDGDGNFFSESEMARFPECTQDCA
jgi:hypothetical protein